MTPTTLKSYTLKDLAQMAKKQGVSGWHSMRKDQLVRALVRYAKAKSVQKQKAAVKAPVPVRKASAPRAATRNGKAPTPMAPVAKSPSVIKRLAQARARLDRSKNLASEADGNVKDKLVVMVRGPFWLHAYWELSPASIARAQVAMGKDWHAAKPILRVSQVFTGGSTSTSERVVRDIVIHGGVRNWYVDVVDPPQSYRLEIGYLASGGRFYALARSNVVTTPAAASSDTLDPHWSDVADNCDKIYAMSGGYSLEGSSTELQELFEQRLRRPMGSPVGNRYGVGAESLLPHEQNFDFEIDAELVIYGATKPEAYVTLQGEPIKLREDGSFMVRLDMPNRRQVIPIVASSKDGVQQRTIVLAVERNTKVMEPVNRESND